jgi:hypothetical protein
MSNEQLYVFRHNSSHTRGYTWAWDIVPRSEIYRKVCPKHNINLTLPRGAFDVSVEGGTKYPDILGCGSYPFLIASERVVTIWKTHNISGFTTYPVGVAEVQSKRLKDMPPPQYYRIEIDGGCKIDLEASGLRIVAYDPDCPHLVTDPLVAPGFQMVANSWDGSDLFRDQHLYPAVTFCTEKVLELAREHHMTNFRFEPMERRLGNDSKGIDYRKKRRRL